MVPSSFQPFEVTMNVDPWLIPTVDSVSDLRIIGKITRKATTKESRQVELTREAGA
jgi:hypothetical protein